LVALLVTVRLAEREPVLVGAKVTLTELDCPGARERGRDVEPPMVKLVPLAVTCEMDTVELPVLLIVTLCVADVPVFKVPKLNAVGPAESCSTCEIPVPLRAMLVGEVGALLTNVRVPE